MKILQKLKDGANRATEKAQHVVEVNKLNSQISEIEQQKNSYYLQMGKVFYEGYRQQDMTIAEKEMVELAQTCDGLQEQIEAIRNRIAVLRMSGSAIADAWLRWMRTSARIAETSSPI